jgi:adenylate cyclase class IV
MATYNEFRKNKYICIGEEKESLKFDSGEEIKPSTECTYLGTKVDQAGDNTTEIKHRINQTRKAINALNSIWWHKDITKKQKIRYIYQTIIQSILMYGAEVWQIPTRELKFYLQKWMC